MSATQKKSPIWVHFSELGGEKAKCNLCQNVYSYKGGTTGNLRKHLRTKHPTLVIEETVVEKRQWETASKYTNIIILISRTFY